MGSTQSDQSYRTRYASEEEGNGSSQKESAIQVQLEHAAAAERRHKQYLIRFQDAYGDKDGMALFRAVTQTPNAYAHDYRRLVSGLAREAMSGASRRTKAALLTEGLLEIFEATDGKGWREQGPGWSRSNKIQHGSWYV